MNGLPLNLNHIALGHMIDDIVRDLGGPRFIWQLGVLILVLGAAWLLARLARHLPLAPAAALRLTRFCWLAALAAPLVQVALPAPALPASPQVWTGPAASAEARLQLRALPASPTIRADRRAVAGAGALPALAAAGWAAHPAL